jgi:hypothetical protein
MLRTLCLARWLLVPASLLLAGPSGAVDQGSPEQRQACAPDAMRLCSDFIPDIPKITTCMKEKRAELSEACRRAMEHRQKPRHYYHRKKPAAPANCGWTNCN